LILNTFPEVGYKVTKRKLLALLLKKVITAAALGVNNVQKHCLGRSALTYQKDGFKAPSFKTAFLDSEDRN